MDCITVESACTRELRNNGLLSPRRAPYAQRPITVTLVSLGKGDEVSLAICTEVPESCSTRVDEMRGVASMIKTDVLAELEGRTK